VSVRKKEQVGFSLGRGEERMLTMGQNSWLTPFGENWLDALRHLEGTSGGWAGWAMETGSGSWL
jgi:hypothetical protein